MGKMDEVVVLEDTERSMPLSRGDWGLLLSGELVGYSDVTRGSGEVKYRVGIGR